MLIKQAYELFGNGKLDEAYSVLDSQASEDNHEAIIIKAIILKKKGEFSEANKLIDNLLNQVEIDEVKFKSLIVKASLHLETGEIKTAEAVIKETGSLFPLLDKENVARYDKWNAFRLSIKGQILIKVGDLDEAINCLSHSLVIRQQLHDQYDIATSLLRLGEAYLIKGELDLALGYHRFCLPLYRELDNQIKVAKTLLNIGDILYQKGNQDLSLQTFYSCMDLFEKLGNKYYIASCNYSIGTIYLQKGDLNKSLENFQRSLKIFHEQGKNYDMSRSLNKLGELYFNNSDLVLAQHYFQKSLEIKKKIGNLIDIASSLNNLGKTHAIIKEYDLSISYYNQSLEIFRQYGNQNQVAYALYELIIAIIDSKTTSDLDVNLSELEEISTTSTNPLNKLYFKIAHAYYLKQVKNDTPEAIVLFKQVVDEKIISFEISIFAMLNFCELLLREVDSPENAPIINEIDNVLKKLDGIALSINSINLTIKIKLLHTKFSFLMHNVEEARIHLSEVDDILRDQDVTTSLNELIIEKVYYDTLLTESVGSNGNLKEKVYPIEDVKTDLQQSISQLIQSSSLIKTEKYPDKDKIDQEVIKSFDNLDRFPSALFKITEMGPVVLLTDFNEYPEKLEMKLDSFLYQLAINFSVIIGQGHNYHEGIFDLPASENHRALLYSFRIADPNAVDKRLELGYLQYCIFVPKSIHQYIPSGSAIEPKIAKMITDVKTVDSINLNRMMRMKADILSTIKELLT
ncbi:MAG: tetratricopeptide repeat protein [Candidatus Kariarchaeaceae archaeon]|jgi:tetratricopeptide (TPR) repeat protein